MRSAPYYPVTGLFAILIGIVILKCLSGCALIDGINNEGNSVKHATPPEKVMSSH